MGNILGKNRTNKTAATRTKSPVDRVIRNLQICPQGIGKKKYFWEKEILETSTAPSPISKSHKDGWQDAALAVPNSNDQNIKELGRPVPPPRKKRSSKVHKDEPIKNGFEDLFLGDKENLKSKSLSNINNTNNSTQIKQSSSPTTNSLSKLNFINTDGIETTIKPTATTLPRKISKVGNKKSDKFFGENLSDCLSDEVITTVDNNIDNIVAVQNNSAENNLCKTLEKNDKDETDKNLQTVNLNDENDSVIVVDIEEEELLRKIKKEKGKLIFSIENHIDTHEDENRFKGEIPVEEDIIVPVKRVYKHICCDDTDIHNALHLHKHIDNITTNQSGPKKPQRDLAKYKKSVNTKYLPESSQKENKSIEEQNANLAKCDNGTQTGKGDIDKTNYRASPELLDYVTQQANLTISDILKSAETAVEQQKQQNNKDLLKTSESINTFDEETIRLDKNILKDDVVIDNNEKINPKSVKLLVRSNSSSDLNNPEIKIDPTNNNNILDDKSESSKLEVPLENGVSKPQSSTRPTRSSEIIPPNLSNSEKIFRRCLSTQSYLTSDLIEKIALQANILSMPGGFSPEDALQCNDGSALVSPNFKLEQKRSLSPQISTISDKNDIEIKLTEKVESTETLNNSETEKFSNDNEAMKLLEKTNNDLKSCEKDIDIKTKIINNTNTTTTPLKSMPHNKVEKRVIRTPNRPLTNNNLVTSDNDSNREVSEAIKIFLNKKDLKPEKMLDLLQYEFGDYIFSQCLPVEDKLIIEDLQRSVHESQIENSITPTETNSSFQFTDKKYNKSQEKHKISKIPVLTNKGVENVSFNDKRRHSIDDLNAWFSPEKDFPLRKRKRETSLPGSLNNSELFNGKGIHANFPEKSVLIEQENEENFEKSANKLVDDILNKAEKTINNTDNVKQHEQSYSNTDQSHIDINGNINKLHIIRNSEFEEDDHSALLKFLEHEKSNNS